MKFKRIFRRLRSVEGGYIDLHRYPLAWIPSNHCCPDNMTQCSSRTVNGKESGWRKAEKAAIPLYRDSGGHSVAMSDPSLYTAVRRSFSIFHRPEFSLHLHALLRRAVCIAGQPVAKSHTRASTSGA